MTRIRHLLFAIAALASPFAGPAFAADGPAVVASIKPIHSLVASVMAGVGEPYLIVRGGASPHTYSLKPSDATALGRAAVVFWVGPGLELFLESPIQKIARRAKVVTLSEAPGLIRLAYRQGGVFETHADDEHGDHGDEAHEDEHATGDDHDHGGAAASNRIDMHLWLDPLNAKALVRNIAATLAKADPRRASVYNANAKKVAQRLDGLTRDVAAKLAPVKGKSFIVFHDAYQYFEKRFGMNAAGSITVSPEIAAGAQRVSEIHRKIRELGATCVFSEPEFEPRLVHVDTEGTPAASGVLDPEGAALTEGPDLYFQLIEGLAASLRGCLGRSS